METSCCGCFQGSAGTKKKFRKDTNMPLKKVINYNQVQLNQAGEETNNRDSRNLDIK